MFVTKKKKLLVEIRNTLLNDLKGQFAMSIDRFDFYRGEFSETLQAVPDTICLVDVIRKNSIVRAPNNQILKAEAIVKIYIGANTKNLKDGLTLTEAVLDFLVGGSLSVDISGEIQKFNISQADSMEKIFYDTGYEVYSILLSIK